MPRAKRKDTNESPIETPASGANAPLPEQHGDAYEGPAPVADTGEKKWTDRVPNADEPRAEEEGPRGAHVIDLGDQRQLRFLRSNRFQQSQIMFLGPDGVDPRPTPDDTAFLKAHGFHWERRDMAWVKPFFTRDEKAEIDAVDRDKGEQEAKKLRSRIRPACSKAAQDTFVQLANNIRARNGREPIDYSFSEEPGQAR